MPKHPYRLALKVLTKRLQMLMVGEALWLLRLYQHEHTEFYIVGQTGALYGTDPISMVTDFTWIKSSDLACQLPVRFCGGPEHCADRKYYSDTFITFLVDRILLSHQRCGSPLAWLIRFDPYSAAPIWAQLKDRIPENMRKYSAHPEKKSTLDSKRLQKTLFDIDNSVVDTVGIGDYQINVHENGGWK